MEGDTGGVPHAEPEVMYPTPIGDLRIAVPAWRVSVEVRGPECFFDGGVAAAGSGWEADDMGTWQRLPSLRMRLLRQLGWHVVEVPFFEWQELLDGAEQRQYLRSRLREAPSCRSASDVGVAGED